MGKRKIHGDTFYQCDYTGLPMRNAYCYLPTWDANGKLVKKGSYCNWESVLKHAAMAHYDSYDAVKAHVAAITGTDRINEAPDYKQLCQFGGCMTALEFHNKCTYTNEPIMGVKIDTTGAVFDVVLTPIDGKFVFEGYLHKPYSYHGPPQVFHSMRKKSSTTGKDLTVLYYPCRDLPPNTVATNTFKMQLYGDVLMVQQSKEMSFLPRERYITYSRQEFIEQFMKKRKRNTTDTPAMSTADYESAKSDMQKKLSQVEQKMSIDAMKPDELVSVAKIKKTAQKKDTSFRDLAARLAVDVGAGAV